MRTPATAALIVLLTAAALVMLGGPDVAAKEKPAKPERVTLPKDALVYDDGDTVQINWPGKDAEIVRILGIDTPEVQHLEHNLPYPQPFGYEAAGFLRGCLAVADKVELLRAKDKDPHGRTLGYIFVDGKNYSALVVEARLAVESVSHYGDNGLPGPAAEVVAAAKRAGPVAFEAPYRYRRRMRDVAEWMKKKGIYPEMPKAGK